MKKLKTSIKIIIFLLPIVIIGLFFYIPFYVTNPIVDMHVDFEEIELEKGIEKLELTTKDKLNIVAYENRVVDSKGTVIMISGIHNPSVKSFFNHKDFLEENNYSSVYLETRSHGESEGSLIGLGYLEVEDLKVLVEYLRNKNPQEKLVLWGFSMGGAIAINSAGQIPEINGVISMSAYSSWEEVLSDTLINMGLPKIVANGTKPFTKFYTLVKYGFKNRKNTPKNQIGNIGERPLLLVHSKEDSQVPFNSFEVLTKNAPLNTETWVLEGDKHMILDDWDVEIKEDEKYCEVVLNFLNRVF